MKMKMIPVVALAGCLSIAALAGCSSSQPASSDTAEKSDEAVEQIELETVEMQKMSAADLEANLDNEDYLVVDVRKAADYDAGHIPGAVSADLDAAVNGDNATGVASLTAALLEATGSENGEGKTMVLVCYSGNKYAQAGTDILNYLGADMGNVYTLDGGMKGWTGETVTE